MLKYWTRPPTAVTHKPQIKERKRKGSRDFPFRVGPLLAAGISRASSATCPPPTRPLVTLFFLTCSHVHRTWTCVSQHVRFLQEVSHSLSVHTLPLLRALWPSAFTTRLFAGVPRSPLPHVLTRAQNSTSAFSPRALSTAPRSLLLCAFQAPHVRSARRPVLF